MKELEHVPENYMSRQRRACIRDSKMKVRLTKDFILEAAQSLPKVPAGHKCGQMHGHTFTIQISVEGEVDPETGWLYDHARISAAMKPIIQQLDHTVLNDTPGLENPTIELMCAWLWKKLTPQLPGLAEIVINETPFARCSYRGE
jgi:6-pyruvoyltetrahydropterin/6-carboxytetrahydropterin synthase